MQFLKILIFAVAPFGAAAHSMDPPSQKVLVGVDTTYVKYNIENKFDWPATFVMELFEKDGVTPFTQYESMYEEISLLPARDKDVYLKIDSSEERKLIVCSKLDKVGYDKQEARTVTRVCAKLWLYR